MTNFDKTYKATMSNEGGYVNDSDDTGGETYKGVARNSHSYWSGWVIVDEHKKYNDFPGRLDSIVELQEKVKEFYKENFWDKFWGDKVSQEDLVLATIVFDASVNVGLGKGIKWLQHSLNVFNNRQKMYADISVDGGFGSKTFHALERFYDKAPYKDVVGKGFCCLQGVHYMHLAKKKEIYEKYMYGWFNRIMIQLEAVA